MEPVTREANVFERCLAEIEAEFDKVGMKHAPLKEVLLHKIGAQIKHIHEDGKLERVSRKYPLPHIEINNAQGEFLKFAAMVEALHSQLFVLEQEGTRVTGLLEKQDKMLHNSFVQVARKYRTMLMQLLHKKKNLEYMDNLGALLWNAQDLLTKTRYPQLGYAVLEYYEAGLIAFASDGKPLNEVDEKDIQSYISFEQKHKESTALLSELLEATKFLKHNKVKEIRERAAQLE